MISPPPPVLVAATHEFPVPLVRRRSRSVSSVETVSSSLPAPGRPFIVTILLVIVVIAVIVDSPHLPRARGARSATTTAWAWPVAVPPRRATRTARSARHDHDDHPHAGPTRSSSSTVYSALLLGGARGPPSRPAGAWESCNRLPLGTTRTRTTTSVRAAATPATASPLPSIDDDDDRPRYQHVVAILTMPLTTPDRIANEAILQYVVPLTNRLSVVLRGEENNNNDDDDDHDDDRPNRPQSPPNDSKSPLPASVSASLSFLAAPSSLPRLRRYVGEVYSDLWDACSTALVTASSSTSRLPVTLCDVVVYPQHLPNAAPAAWLYLQPDVDAICSHDHLLGWTATDAVGTGTRYATQAGVGVGGLDAHVRAVNNERRARQLPHTVTAVHVAPWPAGATTTRDGPEDEEEKETGPTIFLEDEPRHAEPEPVDLTATTSGGPLLFDSVAVGGTWDGLHYGHRKLLTLAASSVRPVTGKLLIGVTADAMLVRKQYAHLIPTFVQRVADVRRFIRRLAPGMMNRVTIVEIRDEFGPPGATPATSSSSSTFRNDFDALVLSHETLATGYRLNRHRVKVLGLPPLALLCTRRTEPHGMSSTAMRRMRSRPPVNDDNNDNMTVVARPAPEEEKAVADSPPGAWPSDPSILAIEQ